MRGYCGYACRTRLGANLAAFVPRYLELLNTMLSKKVEKIEFVPPQKTPQKKGAA
ncbi:MAG: hypothetical protein ACHP78_11900 [Terriglobales bacterium]